MPNSEEIGDKVSLGIIADQIRFLREDFRDLSRKLEESNENKVSHREWSQRNEHVNNRLASLGREIGDMRTEIRAKSAPWWSVTAMIVAGLSLAWTIVGPAITR